jgi:hypothetical protein
MDHNFDLHLAGSPAAVTAQVLDSPAGQTPAPVPLPCTASLAGLDDLATNAALQAIGRALWRSAFGAPAVAELWRASVATADTLRLRLVIDAPELAALPWELLYDETLGRFLALDGRTPVTRFVRLPLPAPPWPQDRPLRLLFTGASPATLPRLGTAAEWAGVELALAPVVAAGRIAVKAIPQDATLADLLAALRRGVDLWHFAGHGTDEGIIFAGAGGREMVVEAETLGQILAGEGVRLAVLNACRAGAGGGQAASVAGSLLRADVPAVVAMQADVSDVAADAFAAAFYDAIAVGQGVDRALTAARKAILATRSSTRWWIPALFMRTADGRLWQAPEQTAGTRVDVQGDRNVVITGNVGGNVTVSMTETSPRRIR